MLQGGVQVGSLLTCIHHSQPSGASTGSTVQAVQEEEGGGRDAQADGEGVVVVEEAAEGVECR